MHYLSSWFTRNPVAANLLMILILIAGYFTVTSIRIEGFPAIPPSSVSIETAYPGASAKQVDQSISRRIEMALEGMPGVKKVSSSSYEGYSLVRVQKVSQFDLDRFQNEIKTRIDSIDSFPGLVKQPVISRDEFSVEALIVQVYGKGDTLTLQKTARMVKKEMLSDPCIAKINTFGLKPYEIRIEIEEAKLKAIGVTLPEAAQAINNNSFYAKQGILKSESGRILIKADSRAFDLETFKNIPIITDESGSLIKVGDVARVIDGFEETEFFARFQGTPSVGMMVQTSREGDLIEISKAAHKIINRLKGKLPDNVHVDIWGESSIYMKARLNLLKSNALQGLLIVFVMLAVFLNVKLALWVAMGIPVSVAGTLALMGPRFLDYSLNDITTFGLIIVLGILVDDAIVVGESIFEERSKDTDPVRSTIKGVAKVSTATVFGCFTTIAAFFPSLLIDNDLGRVFASFSVVVIVSLLVSLVESKLILPAHLSAISITKKEPDMFVTRCWAALQEHAAKGLDFVNSKIYKPFLKHAIVHRYAYLVILITVPVICMGMVFKGHIRSLFFPEVPGQIIVVNMEMVSGAPINLTVKNLNQIEKAAEEVNKEVMEQTGRDLPPIARVLSALTGKQTVEIYAELQPEKTREIETLETLKRWRKKVGDLEGIRKLSFSGSFETAGGFAIQLNIRDDDLLLPAMDELITSMGRIEGVKTVYSDLSTGTPQLSLKLKPQARHMGITSSGLAEQIGDAFGGLEVQRFLRQTSEVKVFIKYKDQKRRYISDLLTTKIQTPSGDLVPLTMIATIESGYAPSGINRKNGVKVATINAELDKNLISPTELFSLIKTTIEPDLLSRYPGLVINGAGELDEIGEMKGGLKKAFIIIIICIYALIAIPLKSYWQPVIIMSVIPFAFVGSVIGHKLTGFPLSILSFLGMLGACGVVVNDSLVMLTQFNSKIKEGLTFSRAVVVAGRSRFRAIFLTTITTVGGLAPLIFETSEQAQYLIPAAIALAFGELIATPATLVLIPILLTVGGDVKKMLASVRGTVLQPQKAE
jgi:multidrug efflux pump subunit AcrB